MELQNNEMQDFDALLAESVQRHGHLCTGQVIGVRMAMLGCRLVEIGHPKSPANCLAQCKNTEKRTATGNRYFQEEKS